MIFYLYCFLIVIEIVFGLLSTNCPTNQVKFEKITGIKPKNLVPLLLYQEPYRRPTTLQCIEKCAEIDDCTGFTVSYKSSTCYWYRSQISLDDESDILDENVSLFIKTCLNVQNCTKKWIFERSPGATLIGNDKKTLPSVVTRRECQQSCLDETSFDCRSAKFTLGHRNGSEIVGRCVLSDTDRHSVTSSFRVSRSDEEYFDNQCSKDLNEKFCPFEEYDNIILSHSDVLYDDKTKEECEMLCQNWEEFNCRGYSILPLSTAATNAKFMCLIHSEDSKLLGPKLLVDKTGSTHFEKAPCLNISVTCSSNDMVIKYTPNINFYGKIYLKAFSENPGCYAKGRGLESLSLKISLKMKQCGIQQAISNTNSTLFHTTMILQYNNLVQTQADRVIRIGCIYGNVTNVVVGTGVNFTNELPNNGSTIVNSTTTDVPNVIMRILDFYTHEEVSETQIGQELELVIEAHSENDSFDISAGHLIAMTPNSEDSILLLDDRGCPTNLNVFPALTKISVGSVKRLVAAFQAFKFSSSPIIRFSVMLMFCRSECPQVDCGYFSNNRIKRDVLVQDASNGTQVKSVKKNYFDKIGKEIVKELPLELVIMVRNPKEITSDKLIFGESHRVLIADYDLASQKVCIDYSVFVSFIILWVLVLVILVVTSICIVRRYKNYYKNLCIQQRTDELNKNFGLGYSNLDKRRVHFGTASGLEVLD